MPTVPLHPRPKFSPAYPIIIGKGVASRLPGIIGKLKDCDHAIVFHDRAVAPMAKSIARAVSATKVIAIASGEQSKSLPEIEQLCRKLLEANVTRKSVLISVGGGMTSDLVGFLASIYMRGIRVVHVPTSLLAMVDAAFGGKTAVDAGGVKNVLGTIHHPSAIVADTAFLRTLPDLQFKEGLVEVVKMAAILDRESLVWLEKNLPAILQRNEKAIVSCLMRAVKMKTNLVEEDGHDLGGRLLLNFGHTVGHTVEALSHFAISHGQAVSIGMACEMRIAGTKNAERVLSLLETLRMPTAIPEKFTDNALWERMQSDKKNVGGTVRIAVPQTLGSGKLRSVTFEEFTCARRT